MTRVQHESLLINRRELKGKRNIAEEGIQRRFRERERQGNNMMFAALIPVEGIKNIHFNHALFA